MAEAPCRSSSRKGKSKVVKDHCLVITESDVDAAQNLSGSKRSRSMDEEKGEEVGQRLSNIIMAKIQEIFGNDIDIEVFPTKKQRRYRSLVSIYMVTRPVNAGNDRLRVKA
ncbi:hypothetical protein GLYMA_05G187200v4 [Glycine max]|uniref:Uncharacterized protein n=2 Tax=Glycine subgen. Soja TaxID=1462606 RepID=K7KR42_SOYBN|nr:hypothetical protein JHK86_013385 [Glycine max]KHN34037.1 hypothetical protein glysoja_030491 [Glycine soja]KAH1135157.1 hypothetical protein GYH30_013104 [Glycine max]KAH1251164.1 hypothetical protein GmHk_05G014136 [Glycine max]KRH59509.1 hypothetical protein GLYMA_05G187200v4 [Glycine max]